MKQTRKTIASSIAKRAINRCSALGLRGIKRDREAIALFAGAAYALEETGQRDLADALITILAFDVALHGYSSLAAIAGE